jgi:signal peptidase I
MNSFLFVSLSCLLSLIIFVLLARTFFFIVTVEGQSMSPTLTNGDRLLAIRFWPARWLRQGQIVVTHYPLNRLPYASDDLGEQRYIKRITGLPGDTIIVKRPNFPPPRSDEPDTLFEPRQWLIPPGHYFVEGDSWGLDSTTVGPLPFQAFCGLTFMKLRRRQKESISQVVVANSRMKQDG